MTILCDGGKTVAGIKDSSNCTVRALAISAGIPYTKADEIITKAGRKRNCGFRSTKVMAAAKKNNIKSRKLKYQSITIQKFLAKHQEGRFFCCISRHAFAVVDGIIYDTVINKPLQRIRAVYQVESQRLDLIKSRLL